MCYALYFFIALLHFLSSEQGLEQTVLACKLFTLLNPTLASPGIQDKTTILAT